MATRILVLDTRDNLLGNLIEAFKSVVDGKCKISKAFSKERLIERLQFGLPWDLLVVDYYLGDGETSGIEILPSIRSRWPDMPIVVVAEHGDVNIASKAIKAGANDFLVRTGELNDRVATLLKKIQPHLTLINRNRMLLEQNKLLREAAGERYQLIGESPQLSDIIDNINKVAQIPRPILITGERGTGKELVARAIHAAAGESGRPMISINCAAFSESLLESEIFGHEKGAFTGADHIVHGKFELAGGGTLFLDEIGSMSLPFQQKILRVVEYGVFVRVGGSEEIQANTRIIAATNLDLKKEMAEGRFLPDLYDRLSFEIIHIPPLRQREGDIVLLARYFLNQFLQEIPSLSNKRLGKSAIDALLKYSFPGNVRELKNIIERAAYRDITNEITAEDIGLPPDEEVAVQGNTFYERVESFKEHMIKDALASSGGNQAKAARSIGLSYHQYRYYLNKY
jgi:DNA-binding NtrC family response regulator